MYDEDRKKAIKKAKISPGLYLCAKCKKKFVLKEIQVDHIIEIGKFVNFNVFIDKLFCNVENLQCLCKSCHKNKTKKSL